MSKKYEPYIECRCISSEFVKDVNKIFNDYIQLKLDKYGFSKITAEQIDLIESSINLLSEEVQVSTRNNLVYVLEHPQESKTLEYIKRYLQTCQCPSDVKINYKDGFHTYKNIKVMLKSIMGE